MEGTVAEDRFSKSSLVVTNAEDSENDSARASDSKVIVGYCTEPGEEKQEMDEPIGFLGPESDSRKEKNGGCASRTGNEAAERVVDGNERVKRPCKTCAERRKKKAERRQSLASSTATDDL